MNHVACHNFYRLIGLETRNKRSASTPSLGQKARLLCHLPYLGYGKICFIREPLLQTPFSGKPAQQPAWMSTNPISFLLGIPIKLILPFQDWLYPNYTADLCGARVEWSHGLSSGIIQSQVVGGIIMSDRRLSSRSQDCTDRRPAICHFQRCSTSSNFRRITVHRFTVRERSALLSQARRIEANP